MKYAITGIGVTGGFGCSRCDLEETITRGEIALSQQIVTCGNESKKIDYHRADSSRLENFIAKKNLRRTDHYSQLALLATFLAIEDRGGEASSCTGDNTGIIIASGYGSVGSTCLFKDSIFESNDMGASPMMFSRSVHNQASSHLAIQLGVTGPNLTISQHSLSFHSALQTACIWLEENRVKRVIVGGVDEFVEVLGYSRLRFLADNDDRSTMLTDLQNPDVIPGEGAGFFLLEKRAGRAIPAIEMPQIGKVDRNTRDLLTGAGRVIVYGNGEFEDGENRVISSAKRENPRQWYGEFPTASALDLAYALFTGKKGESTHCMQITSDSRYGCVQLTHYLS